METSPADGITTSTVPWQRLVTFDSAGFSAYARLRYLPDPSYEGPSENDAEDEGDEGFAWRAGQWTAIFQMLPSHTVTADDCYICIWDGYADHGPTPPALARVQCTRPAAGTMPPRYPDGPAPG